MTPSRKEKKMRPFGKSRRLQLDFPSIIAQLSLSNADALPKVSSLSRQPHVTIFYLSRIGSNPMITRGIGESVPTNPQD
jgi:hypothetical protein